MSGPSVYQEKPGRKISLELPIMRFHRSKQMVLMMDRFADDGKLGQGFILADDLVEVDIGSGDRP